MAKASATSVTAFENKNIEGATKSAPSESKKSSGKKSKATGKAVKADKPKATAKVEKAKPDNEKSDAKTERATGKAEIILAENTSVVACTKEQVEKHLKSLDDAVKSFEKTFFKIGLELYWFYTTQAYISICGKEYVNVADFAKNRYGISKATTYQYIKVYDKFGERNACGDCIGIAPDYTVYSSTQLIVMSQMDDATLKKCTPDQKICEMKALLKGISENDDDGDENGDDNGNSDNGDERKPFNVIKKLNTQELYSISSMEELEKLKNEIFETIKKTVGTGVNGIKYGVSIVMTW